MGKDNKARRAAKARARRRAHGEGAGFSSQRHGWSGDEQPLGEAELAARLVGRAVDVRRAGGPVAPRILERLREVPPSVLETELERRLLANVGLLWANGWQPSELLRQGRRGSTPAGGRLVGLAIATDHVGRRATTLDPRWTTHVESLELPAVDGGGGWVARWASTEGLMVREMHSTIIDVLTNLSGLPPLDPLMPGPGSRWSDIDNSPCGRGAGAVDDPVLRRVRALLAKAESTTFEPEAMAFTAKAQELMARHAIDAALLDAGHASHERPVAQRVSIDEPYVDAKSLLLQVVAAQSRCQSVCHPALALSTLIGFATDVCAVEMLFTSLLVQAQAAMSTAARHAPPGTRTRSRGYRSAFLLAYADRIGDRLAEINDCVLKDTEAERGGAFLPALQARSSVVDDAISERFGDLVTSPVRGGQDAAGWAGGRVAADNAQLAFAHIGDDGPTAERLTESLPLPYAARRE